MKTYIKTGKTNKIYVIKNGKIQSGYDVVLGSGCEYDEEKKAIKLKVGGNREIKINTPIKTDNKIGLTFIANSGGTNISLISGTTSKYYFLLNKAYLSTNFTNNAEVTFIVNPNEDTLINSGGVPPVQDTFKIIDNPTGKETLIKDFFIELL